MIKLFVGGFPLDITELELVQILSLHGEVVTIKIVRDKKTRLCKGYAFVEVKGYDDATQIIEALDGSPIADRSLTINIVEEKPEPPKPKSFKPYTPRPRETNDAGAVRAKRPRVKN